MTARTVISYRSARSTLIGFAACMLSAFASLALAHPGHGVARSWNDALLDAIRTDFARPTVHARNLYHLSAAMWDGWANYDTRADALMHDEPRTAADVAAVRRETISYAAYRLLRHRFASSPGNDPENPGDPDNTLNRLRQVMLDLGYDPDFNNIGADSPAGLGLRIAQTYILYGLEDGANEAGGYANLIYQPSNPPLDVTGRGNPDIVDPNRWQPLTLGGEFIDQAGNPIPNGYPPFLSPEWGQVEPFANDGTGLSVYSDPELVDWQWWVYDDPGPPPQIGGPGDASYKLSFVRVVESSSKLDPDDGVSIDISPASQGNNALGSNEGSGYNINPVTGQPYATQVVPQGDYYRVMAEFWADGPDSETPPGHWFTILNGVMDDPEFEPCLQGVCPAVDQLEWEVKAYLAMGGAVQDAAVAAWSVKGYYDYIRPVSAIRYMADQGQSSNEDLPSYHPRGIPLVPGLIEVVTPESTASGQRHEHLAGEEGEIAIRTWRGHVPDPESSYAGVGWILADNWWPYQLPSFVTPPFAGYVSGHSTFSRAAAEVLTYMTGSPYFPGGLGEYCFTQNDFLRFELGPSVDVCLQWASYYDAADQSGLSRIYGGIHPPVDDIPGRLMGSVVGVRAFNHAKRYFEGHVRPIFADSF